MIQLSADQTFPQAPLPPLPSKACEGKASLPFKGLCRTLSDRERAETLTIGGEGPLPNTVQPSSKTFPAQCAWEV